MGTYEPLRRLVSSCLAASGLRGVVADVGRGGELPDPAVADVAILLGSSRTLPGDAQVDWIRRADEAGARVLAIGGGATPLALTFGASRHRLARPYQGWSFVRTRAPHLIATGPWLTWQDDVIRLEPAGEVLADNRLGPQAFRFGAHVGLRFDPVANDLMPGVFGHAAALGVPARVMRRDPIAAQECARRLITAFCDDRL